MKKIFTSIAVITSLATYAQNINIPFDLSNVTMDGKINPAEWQYADSVKLGVSANDTVTVFFKHDMVNMYFAFAGKLESNNLSPMYPEVLIDPQYDQSNSWVSGQWWFHVSATDCENEGGYGVYNNCNTVQPDWQGVPNVAPGPPYTDSIEFKIPYSKIGFNAVTQYDMGIAFVMTNKNSIYELWPSTADKDVPATWSKAKIIKFPVGITGTTDKEDIEVYPNPTSKYITLSNIKIGSTVNLIDAVGRVVYTNKVNRSTFTIETRSFAKGVYQIQIVNEGSIANKKVLLN